MANKEVSDFVMDFTARCTYSGEVRSMKNLMKMEELVKNLQQRMDQVCGEKDVHKFQQLMYQICAVIIQSTEEYSVYSSKSPPLSYCLYQYRPERLLLAAPIIDLLRLLTWSVTQLFTSGAAISAIRCWQWLLAAKPDIHLNFINQMVLAWNQTHQMKLGQCHHTHVNPLVVKKAAHSQKK